MQYCLQEEEQQQQQQQKQQSFGLPPRLVSPSGWVDVINILNALVRAYDAKAMHGEVYQAYERANVLARAGQQIQYTYGIEHAHGDQLAILPDDFFSIAFYAVYQSSIREFHIHDLFGLVNAGSSYFDYCVATFCSAFHAAVGRNQAELGLQSKPSEVMPPQLGHQQLPLDSAFFSAPRSPPSNQPTEQGFQSMDPQGCARDIDWNDTTVSESQVLHSPFTFCSLNSQSRPTMTGIGILRTS
jgi:hypothetical protein